MFLRLLPHAQGFSPHAQGSPLGCGGAAVDAEGSLGAAAATCAHPFPHAPQAARASPHAQVPPLDSAFSAAAGGSQVAGSGAFSNTWPAECSAADPAEISLRNDSGTTSPVPFHECTRYAYSLTLRPAYLISISPSSFTMTAEYQCGRALLLSFTTGSSAVANQLAQNWCTVCPVLKRTLLP